METHPRYKELCVRTPGDPLASGPSVRGTRCGRRHWGGAVTDASISKKGRGTRCREVPSQSRPLSCPWGRLPEGQDLATFLDGTGVCEVPEAEAGLTGPVGVIREL